MTRKHLAVAVVDDSKAMLITFEAMLKKLGVDKVICFSRASDAIAEIEKDISYFDCVFTDLNMPEMDGMSLIRRLGELSYLGGVIIVSEMDERVISLASELAKQHKTHLLGNISKPFIADHIELLLERLRQFSAKANPTVKPISEQDLIEAIENGFITPYYQAKIDSKTNKVISMETLMRLVRPGCVDALLPEQFMPTAEAMGIENILTFQLVEKAAAHLSQMYHFMGDEFKLAINLSPKQMQDTFCAQQIETILCVNGLSANQVIIEITEEYALRTTEQLETLNRLRMAGYGISLDDFGTGFTNLEQLRTLPFTEIKIDRSFIKHIAKDRFSQVIVRSLVDVALNTKVDIVAEGIEDFSELGYLQKLHDGIILQGFLICRPKPFNEIKRWHLHWKKLIDVN